jgi:hypothetical protein
MVRLLSSIKQIGSIMNIDHVNLSGIDLNLLVALDALLRTRREISDPLRLVAFKLNQYVAPFSM